MPHACHIYLGSLIPNSHYSSQSIPVYCSLILPLLTLYLSRLMLIYFTTHPLGAQHIKLPLVIIIHLNVLFIDLVHSYLVFFRAHRSYNTLFRTQHIKLLLVIPTHPNILFIDLTHSCLVFFRVHRSYIKSKTQAHQIF